MVNANLSAKQRLLAIAAAIGLSSSAFAGVASAADAEPKITQAQAPTQELTPRIHHAPPAVVAAGQPMIVEASVDHPERLARAVLVYRFEGRLVATPFTRSSRANAIYVASVPAPHVALPSLAYTIEIERVDGVRLSSFASREDLHAVVVAETVTEARERAALERLGGRRSVVATSGEFVDFGDTRARVTPAVAARDFRDQYYKIEGAYTYRFLQTVTEFGLRAGVVRGQSVVPNERDPAKFDVGLNYAAPRLRLRASDWVHLEGEALTSVTEIGFAVGGAGAIILGDPYGGKLTLGFEGIEVFGVRGYSRLDLVLSRRITVAPILEVTTMPHASQAGVRLLGDVGLDLGRGFGLLIRGGYQARTFASGGPSAGAGASYAF